MKEKILTDNAGEKMTVKWDRERFALTKQIKGVLNATPYVPISSSTIILNPREMLVLIEFAGKCGGELR